MKFIEIEEDEDDEPLPDTSRRGTIALIAHLKCSAVEFGSLEYNFTASNHFFRSFRAYLQRENLQHGKQIHIDSFYSLHLHDLLRRLLPLLYLSRLWVRVTKVTKM